MKLIHRYVLRELIGPALMGLWIFTFVLLLRQLFDIIELIMTQGAERGLVLRMLLLLLPRILTETIPVALLVASLLTFGRLATDREIMAMRSSGINLLWVVAPAIGLGLLVSLFLLALNLAVLPRIHVHLTDLRYQLLFRSVTALEPGKMYDEFSIDGQEIRFMFDDRGERPGEMHGVQILAKQQSPRSGQENLMLLLAERGQVAADIPNRSISLNLSNGQVQIRPRTVRGEVSPPLRVMEFERLEERIQPELGGFDGGHYRASPSEMSIAELKDTISSEKDRDDRTRLRIEMHRRFVFPFSALVFALIGIPFGTVTRTSGKGLGLAFSLILLLVYFGLFEWGTAIAATESPLTLFALWTPNIALGLLGLGMLWWISKR